jgi:hypothetical protein
MFMLAVVAALNILTWPWSGIALGAVVRGRRRDVP